MNRRIASGLVAGFLLFAAPSRAQDDTTRILFIGNSHTYMNDVPRLVANLAASGGHPVTTAMSAPGGYTLLQHTTYQPSLDLIAQGGWDYVSLQEQSLYPVIDYYRFNSFYPAARFLDSLITERGYETILYMTWGRARIGSYSIGGYYTIFFNGFFHMQDSVSASFYMLGDELGCPVVPAGDAWATAMHADTSLFLWQADSLHATLPGSYLAACTFYATLFHASPVGLPYWPAGMTQEEALFYQQMADQTVTGIDDDPPDRPEWIGLFQSYPNPFNANTTFVFDLPEDGHVSLSIYNVLGGRVRDLADTEMSVGRHRLTWNGRDGMGVPMASGIYFSVLRQGETARSIRLLYIK